MKWLYLLSHQLKLQSFLFMLAQVPWNDYEKVFVQLYALTHLLYDGISAEIVNFGMGEAELPSAHASLPRA